MRAARADLPWIAAPPVLGDTDPEAYEAEVIPATIAAASSRVAKELCVPGRVTLSEAHAIPSRTADC